ncbi:MAG: heme-binding protein [Alphaproteobacteria bacterium]|nr:heme-binding protein [Alphaproteobacteria bacterium]
MPDVVAHSKLTHDGALKLLQAGIAKAQQMGVPQCIAVVDDGGNLLAFVRMDGAKFLSATSALNKAKTAASIRAATGGAHAEIEVKLAVATGGSFTNLKGGLPVIVNGHCVGAVGVGSGTGDQDAEVGRAALAAIGAQAV